MNIDKIYNEVIEKLQTEFGWSSLEQLSGMHEELVQDVIKAINLVKNNGVLDDVSKPVICQDWIHQDMLRMNYKFCSICGTKLESK
jgi:hypothetical protein